MLEAVPAGASRPLNAPRRMLWYTGPIIAIGLVLIGWSLYRLPSTVLPAGWITLGLLSLLAARFELKVPGIDAHLSVSDTFFFASLLLFGPAPAIVMIALDSLVMSWRLRHRLEQRLFNPASSAIALWGAAQVYYAIAGGQPMAMAVAAPQPRAIVGLVAMAAVHFALNSALTCTAIALDSRTNPWRLWRDRFAILSLSYFVAASAAFFLIVTWQSAGVFAVAIVVPLVALSYVAMRAWSGRLDDAEAHVASMGRLYLSTIGAFSTAIEAKDGVTSQHIHRVQAYALALARVMGVTDQSTVQALEAAALLHDTGKLAIPEHILNKPGKLTAEEYDVMKQHVDVGAEVLSSIDFPYPVVPIVRAHHENWDGTGYPAGLAGREIPIGARILSLVDCYDALTSDRPYRRALDDQQAMAIIVERRGTMYDPQIVDAFQAMRRELVRPEESSREVQQAIGRIRGNPRVLAAPPPVADAMRLVREDDLLAFVSLSRLAKREPTFSDVGGLVSSHLTKLAPGGSFAIFVPDASRATLVAECTGGPAAVRLDGLHIAVGMRISGWVSANGKAAINAAADLDLDPERLGALRYATALPLMVDAACTGVLAIYAAEPLADETRRKLELISPHLASLIALAHQSNAAQPEHRPTLQRLHVMPRRSAVS